MAGRKQALVMIHGIGEQTPMKTLRGFVETLWTADPSVRHPNAPGTVWSKPDNQSRSFELRRLTTARNKSGVRTDFFEFYWAHHISGSTFFHLLAWLKTLFFRRPIAVNRSIVLAWCLAWILVVAGLAGFLAYLFEWRIDLFGLEIAFDRRFLFADTRASSILIPLVFAALANAVLLPIIGDAARYLRAAPYNIQARHEILSEGVSFLRTLIDSGKYERIVVVGHSLGSVIGYDILTHAWHAYNKTPPARGGRHEARDRLQNLAAAGDGLDVEAYRSAQADYLAELRDNGNPWCVSDFITLGSPLSAGAWLLAEDRADFDRRISERELPTCPPVLETEKDGGAARKVFTYPVETRVRGEARDYRAPHHAAVFASVRWTNIYFPTRFIFWGDIIGGPLRPVFGAGIKDMRVTTRQRLGLLTHTLYWRRSNEPNEAHIEALRRSVDLLDLQATARDTASRN